MLVFSFFILYVCSQTKTQKLFYFALHVETKILQDQNFTDSLLQTISNSDDQP